MRLFVALDVPDDVARYMSQVQREVKQEIKASRWQPSHNLHLTLHFLGEVEESLVPVLQQDIDMVSSVIPAFSLSTGYLGVFPSEQKPRVLWLGLSGALATLKQLHLLLGKRFHMHRGLQYDHRPYQPHITLARNVVAEDGPLRLDRWKEQIHTQSGPRWQVQQVHLYHSELRPEGAKHTILHSSSLSQLQPTI